jgi:hypothetical protein
MTENPNNPLDKIIEPQCTGVLEVWAFIRYAPVTALKTGWAYNKTLWAVASNGALAAAVAVSGTGITPTISQEQALKPNEHLSSQSHFTEITDEASALVVYAQTTGRINRIWNQNV